MLCRLHAASADSGDADSSYMTSDLFSGGAKHAHVPTKAKRSWQSLAKRRLQSGKMKLKQLALSMPEEMPCDLLDYLNPCLSPSLKTVNKQMQASLSQLDQQTAAAANSSLPSARPAEAAACAKSEVSAVGGSKPECVSSLSTQSTELEASRLNGKCPSPLRLRLRSYRSSSRSSMDSGEHDGTKGPRRHKGSSGSVPHDGSLGSALDKGSSRDAVKSTAGPRAAYCSLHDHCAVSSDRAAEGISAHAPDTKECFSAAMASARDCKAVAETESSNDSSSTHSAFNKPKTSDTMTKPIVHWTGKSAEAAADARCRNATGPIKLSCEALTAADAAAAAASQGNVTPALLSAKAAKAAAASPAATPKAAVAAIASAATASAGSVASAPVVAGDSPAIPSTRSVAAALQSSVTRGPKQLAFPFQGLSKRVAGVPQHLAGVPEAVSEPFRGIQLASSQQAVSAGTASSATTPAAQVNETPKGSAPWVVPSDCDLVASGQAAAAAQAGCSTAPQASVAQKAPFRSSSIDDAQMAAQALPTQATTPQLSACRESASDAPPTTVAQAAAFAACQATDAAAAAGSALVSASASDTTYEAYAQTGSSDKRPAPDAPATAAKSLNTPRATPSPPPRALPSACAASPTAATASAATAAAAVSRTIHTAAKATAAAISPAESAMRETFDWSEAHAAVTRVSHMVASDRSYQQEHASKALDMLHALSSASEASTPLAAAAAAAALLSERPTPMTQTLSSSLPFTAGITGSSKGGFQQSDVHAAAKQKLRASKFDFRAAAMAASCNTSKAFKASAAAKAFPIAAATTHVPSLEAVQAAAAAAACVSSVTAQDKSSVSSARLALPSASEAIDGAADTPGLDPCSSAATQAAPQPIPQPSDAPSQAPQPAPLSAPLLQPQPAVPPNHPPVVAIQPSAATPENPQTLPLPIHATEAPLPFSRPVASPEQADKGGGALMTPVEPSKFSPACGSCSATVVAKQATSLRPAPAHTARFEAAKASRFDFAKAVTKAVNTPKASPAAQGTASLPRAAAQTTMPIETTAFSAAWEAVNILVTTTMSAAETEPEVAAPTIEQAKLEAKLDTARRKSVVAGLEALKRAHQALECCSPGMSGQLEADFDSVSQHVDNLLDMEHKPARAEDQIAAYQKAQANFQAIRLL